MNLKKVPLSCITIQPRSIECEIPARYWSGVPLTSWRNGPLTFSTWILPSCTASTPLAISMSLRAAASGSASGLLIRSGRFLNDQFEYKFSLSSERHLLALQARFGNAFGLVVFGSTTPGLIEKHVDHLRETHPLDDEGPGPFTILQSATLPAGPAA